MIRIIVWRCYYFHYPSEYPRHFVWRRFNADADVDPALKRRQTSMSHLSGGGGFRPPWTQSSQRLGLTPASGSCKSSTGVYRTLTFWCILADTITCLVSPRCPCMLTGLASTYISLNSRLTNFSLQCRPADSTFSSNPRYPEQGTERSRQ